MEIRSVDDFLNYIERTKESYIDSGTWDWESILGFLTSPSPDLNKSFLEDKELEKKWRFLISCRDEMFGDMCDPSLYRNIYEEEDLPKYYRHQYNYSTQSILLYPTINITSKRQSSAEIRFSFGAMTEIIFPSKESAYMFYDLYREDLEEYNELIKTLIK